MSQYPPETPENPEPRLVTRFSRHPDYAPDTVAPAEPDDRHPHHPAAVAATLPPAPPVERTRRSKRRTARLALRATLAFVIFVAILGVTGYFFARHWIRTSIVDSLPQVDGTLAVDGLAAPVTVQRDAQGVPHIHASSVDDLVFAQAFVTAGDRLFQMDLLRRHASGELAEILGSNLVEHDKLQRTLQIRAAADRAIQVLPADQLHLLEVYARGVNASIAAQSAHLPVEFKVLGYEPAAWTPRDSLLISLAMFEDLTTYFPVKLAREQLTDQLRQNGAGDLAQDLYPTTTWRDHPPTKPEPDLTLPGPPIEAVPLDESQASLRPSIPSSLLPNPASIFPFPSPCNCRAGSNNWVVSGSHTASGKPLLSNDMHLNTTLPGLWYEADLEAPAAGSSEPLHVAGVSIPGLPLIVVGHNKHVAWGFTNLGADVQDIYIETTRGSGDSEEFQAVAAGQPANQSSWQPVQHLDELIRVKHGRNLHFTVSATRHGDALTPILTPILKSETRTLALRWTIYDPHAIQVPVLDVATMHDWSSFLAAFAKWGGPGQNAVYADDQNHIGYHAVGQVPLRGAAPAAISPRTTTEQAETQPETQSETQPDPGEAPPAQPPTSAAAQRSGPLSPVPLVPTPDHEWSGYIPFDQLPQVYDPPGGVIATANARVTPDDYPYPVSLDWGSPYRNERIWKLLDHRANLKPADMLAIETDVYSDFDHVLAQRLAYAIDHSLAAPGVKYKPAQLKTLHQAADLLRAWDGRLTTDSAAAAVVSSVHTVLWPLLLEPHIKTVSNQQKKNLVEAAELYKWDARDYALEELLQHTPQRWLPQGYASWNDFLAAAVLTGLSEAHAPADLSKWRYGSIHKLDIEHPIFSQSPLLAKLVGRPIGTGEQPQSGGAETIKQVGRTFGPSERFTADLGDLDHSTLNIVLGQSGNLASPWLLDQFPAWYHGTTYPLPFSDAAVQQSATHTLTLQPR